MYISCINIYMSGTLNKVMLIGHLGDDVKIKHFDNGGCIARFPMATNETYTNKSTNEKVMIAKLLKEKEKYLLLIKKIQDLNKDKDKLWLEYQGLTFLNKKEVLLH